MNNNFIHARTEQKSKVESFTENTRVYMCSETGEKWKAKGNKKGFVLWTRGGTGVIHSRARFV